MATKNIPNREPLNMVQEQYILQETITKEMRSHKLTTDFTINPFSKMQTVTGKVNSFADAELEQIKGDEQMKAVIKRSRLPPTQKQIYPNTSSQEYGWISTPLIDTDKSDNRLYFGRNSSAITRIKEAQLKIGV